MYPQSELQNYKLQVELLQEKLQRSEERRQQLEDKFENIMKKRSEHERLMRAKSRLKYQQFLQEQSERNERNKSLVRALERIDQQATAFAARSERLKILKVQYELFFSRIPQFRGGPNALFNYSIYSLPPTRAISSNLNYSVDSSSPNTKMSFTQPTANVGDYDSMPEIDPYRHAVTIIPEDTIVSIPAIISEQQRWEVNLKPNVKDLISTTTGISSPVPHNQSSLFTGTRISIDSSRYKAEDPNVIEHSFNASREGADTPVSNRPWSSQHNLRENANETRGPSRSYGDIDNLQHVTSSLLQGSELSRSPEQFLAPNLQHQPFKLDKLHPINRDEALGKMLAKLYDDGCGKDAEGGEKSTEESEARCNIERKNMSVIKERIIDAMESQLTPAQITENVEGSNMSGGADATIALNHNGRVDKLVADYVPNIKKKEKLSIETIENAIYGERISPASSLSEKRLSLEKLGQEFAKNLTMKPCENAPKITTEDMKPTDSEIEYLANASTLHDNQSQQKIEDEDCAQQSNQEYLETANDSDFYTRSDEHFNLKSSNDARYEPQQYQNEVENYQDTLQYEYTGQQPPLQDYSFSQNPEQIQEHAQPQDPEQHYTQNDDNYEVDATVDYPATPDMQYTQYPQGDYTDNQYNTYDQSYAEQYQATEYDQNSSGQNLVDPPQVQHNGNVEYDYQQQGADEFGYDPNTKAYSEADNVGYDPNIQAYSEADNVGYNPETQAYSEADNVSYDPNTQVYSEADNVGYNPSTNSFSETPYEPQTYQQDQQDYYQYNEDSQIARDGYDDQQSNEYAVNADNFATTPYPIEPSQYETDTLQSNAPKLDSESSSAHLQTNPEERNLPLTSSTEEVNQQETLNVTDQLEAVKPSSILAAGEKSYESSPMSNKGKKKKRVNFVETDDNSSKGSTNGKADSKVARSDINPKSSPNTK